jgi:hypothetical protein
VIHFFRFPSTNLLLICTFNLLKDEINSYWSEFTYGKEANQLSKLKIKGLIAVMESLIVKLNGKKYKKELAACKFVLKNIKV